MYLVVQRGEYSDDVSRTIQLAVRESGGFILMVTRNGPIVAVDDRDAEALKRHHLIESVHGVTLNPRGIAAERLQQIFAENLQKQL